MIKLSVEDSETQNQLYFSRCMTSCSTIQYNCQNSYGQFVYFCAWWMIEQSFLSNCQFAHDQTWNVSLKKSISSQPMHDMDNIALALFKTWSKIIQGMVFVFA